jgi:hypothetical protein
MGIASFVAILIFLFLGITASIFDAAKIIGTSPVVDHIICFAIKILPSGQRDRFEEEWTSEKNFQQGELHQLLWAIELIRGAFLIRCSHLFSTERKYKTSKFVLDKLVGCLILLLLAPLILSIAIIVKMSHRASIFVKKRYFDLKGREIDIYYKAYARASGAINML